MNLKMQGMDGVQTRMDELRGRISAKFRTEPAEVLSTGDAQNFQKQLQQKQDGAKLLSQIQNGGMAGLSGQISEMGGSQIGGGLAPMRPLGVMQMSGGMDKASIQAMLRRIAVEEKVDFKLLDAITSAESNYNPAAISPAGAQGLMQLMPATAKSLGVKNSFDPEQNARGGARYLRGLIGQYDELSTAIAAYNAGPGNVKKYGGIPPFKETQDYVKKVMAHMNSADNNTGLGR